MVSIIRQLLANYGRGFRGRYIRHNEVAQPLSECHGHNPECWFIFNYDFWNFRHYFSPSQRSSGLAHSEGLKSGAKFD